MIQEKKAEIMLIFKKSKKEDQVNHRPVRQAGNWGKPAWIY